MRRALVVDDDKAILMVVEKVLKNLGLQVETAPDAHQALRLMRLLSFDLIMTDANMPSLSGYELVEMVSRNKKNFGTPKIIMLTGRIAARDGELALTVGVHKVLHKPVDVELVQKTVTELLGLENIYAARDGISVSEKARWIDAFEILRIYADGVEFTSQTLLRAGLQIDLGSSILGAISSTFVQVEVTACIAGVKDGEYTVSARYRNIQPQDYIAMQAWLAAGRKAA